MFKIFNIKILVELISSQFYLLLSPEFLGALTNFVVIPKSDTIEFDSNEELINRINVVSTEKIVEKTKSQPKNLENTLGSLTMNIKIHAVEVILIENSLKPNDSQALILSFNTFLNAKNVSF